MKRITKSVRVGLLGAVAVATLGLSAVAAQADTIAVYVGYADNLRPSGFFPTPWLGDSNVVSQSPANQTFDSGAIRIDNNGGSSIDITNFQVYFPNINFTYTLWNTLTIGAGQIGIFAQNNFADTQFDTSDFGIFGAFPPASLNPSGSNLIGGCSSPAGQVASAGETAACDAAVPVISFMIGSTSYSFNDTGHILDTGGWDFVNNGAFNEDGNESINWNAVGAPASRGGNVPEPLTITLLGAGLAGIGAMRRRRKAA